MRAIGINNKIVNIIENMYNKTICSVVIVGYQTGWSEVTVGVRQGCFLSSTFVMQEVKWLQEQITFDDDLSINQKYTDSIILIA